MTESLSDRPRLSVAAAEAVAREIFGVSGRLRALPSDRDQNFHLRIADGDEFVLKLSNAGEKRELLELQQAVWSRLGEGGERFRYPRLRPTTSGSGIAEVEGEGGRRHLVRLLEFLPGVSLASAKPHPRELMREVGELVGSTMQGLDGFHHPAASRRFKWDLRTAPETIGGLISPLPPERRGLIESLGAAFESRVRPTLADLPLGVVHNDINDHNVLLGPIAFPDGELPRRRVIGLIDFGDVIEGWRVVDPAVALAYSMLGKPDPLAAAEAVVGGVHATAPLAEEEIAALLPLGMLRLALSVCHSADQRRQEPHNDYLSISEAPAWQLLELLQPGDWDLAHFRLRAACGLEPCPKTSVVVDWLRTHREQMAPIVEPTIDADSALTFDLGVGSLEAGGGAPGSFDSVDLTNELFGRLRRAGKRVGIGRYDEARNWYGGELFEATGNERPERRSVHLGIDLFLQPGAPVFAPLEGWVASLRDNVGRLDYGPTVILGHRPAEGVRFFTLYGHLTAESLDRLQLGRPIAAGKRVGAIGDLPTNGDWPPHLHFQLIVDMLDRRGEFPGVARPSERSVWLSISPDPNLVLGIDDGLLKDPHLGSGEIARLRQERVAPSLSLSYNKPLNIVRGFLRHLYDETGQPYLDAVNNVPQVGHSHPRVVDAVARQTAVLNTNTRYLHEGLVRYSDRLANLLPEPLEVCFLVCSGSEANELAVRIARTVTGRHRIAVVDGAYHGNSNLLIDLSPYKHDGPGGHGAPEWVHTTALPDPYRGPLRERPGDPGALYAAEVAAACESARSEGRRGLAAFIVEPLLGCGGQIVPPEGYLRRSFEHVREAGGLCIADEVQIGLGRVGSHFSAFEAMDTVPDILTLGKPIGNGFPLAAVVTSRRIADAFANGMEYFNTFGGNPVACAAGMAVLDVLEEEELQRNAATVGVALLDDLRDLLEDHPLVGDVRGQGLYLGVELVLDRETRAPAAEAASYVVQRMKDHGILMSTDGPDHNVLKIKPPLCFTLDDAERTVMTLDRILAEDYLRDLPASP